MSLPAEAHPDLHALMPALRSAVAAGRAPSTMEKYEQHFSAFQRWCEAKDCSYLPALPITVGLYLAYRLETASTASVVKGPLTAINYYHRAAGAPAPGECPMVQHVVDAALRRFPAAANKKAPLPLSDLASICTKLAPPGATLADLMIATAAAVAFTGMLRYDDVKEIMVDSITLTADTLTFFLPKRKNDQYRTGTSIILSAAPGRPYCPVTLTSRLLARAALSGHRPLFSTGVSPTSYGRDPLSYSAYSTRLAAAFASVGLDKNKYSSHSLRSGGATTAANAGIPQEDWQEHGGWRNAATAQGYVHTSVERRAAVTTAMYNSPLAPPALPPASGPSPGPPPGPAAAAPTAPARRRHASGATPRQAPPRRCRAPRAAPPNPPAAPLARPSTKRQVTATRRLNL